MKFLIFVLVVAVLITAPAFSYLYWGKGYSFVSSLITGFLIGMFLYPPISYCFGILALLFQKKQKNESEKSAEPEQ